MKRAAFYTLGCKVNQYETQAIAELFERAGYEIVSFDEAADVYVINTCTVTGMSDRKSRQILRRAGRHNPDAVTVVTGCYAQTAPDEVAAIEGVDLVIGTQGRARIVEMVEALSQGGAHCCVSDIMHTHEFEELSVSGYSERTRAYIKVQEGCSQFCSYCIIPYARGPVRSRALADVLVEAERLAEAGFCEVVLTGIHVASYGKDLGDGENLADLIGRVAEVEGIRRIRLSSIEPMTLDGSFLSAVSGCGKLCDHFHLSLQSGCDATLKRMNRHYSAADYCGIVEGLRAAFNSAAITTDVMVGFPGEDENEFAESLAFVESMGFADLHVFAYSPRRGTRAAAMPDQVSPADKHRRSEAVIAAGKRSRAAFLERHVGRQAEVLFEREAEGQSGVYEGKTTNYITVRCKADADLSGRLRQVRLLSHDGDAMEGILV